MKSVNKYALGKLLGGIFGLPMSVIVTLLFTVPEGFAFWTVCYCVISQFININISFIQSLMIVMGINVLKPLFMYKFPFNFNSKTIDEYKEEQVLISDLLFNKWFNYIFISCGIWILYLLFV